MDVRVKSGDSTSTMAELFNSLPAEPVFRTSVQYLIAFYSRLETASEVVYGRFVRLTIPDKRLTFRYPRLYRSREVRQETVGCFANFNKRRLDVAGDAGYWSVWMSV